MRSISKYSLLPNEPVTVSGGARLLVRHVSADIQGSPTAPSVWIELDDDTNVPQEDLILVFVNTGDPVPEGVHVGSCNATGGAVWHVFATRKTYV